METKNAEQDIEIAKIVVSSQNMEKTVDRLAGLMEGKDGVLVRLGNVIGHSKVQWGFIAAIIMGLLYGRFG